MTDTEFRITYTIERRRADDEDFVELGFGSSTDEASVEAALYSAQSSIQNGMWETAPGQPDPADVLAEATR